MNQTFSAISGFIDCKITIEAEIIGQLAIHHTLFLDETFGVGYQLSHAASGYCVWDFADWVPVTEIRRLVDLLADQNFDTYADGGFRDKAFVEHCKAIYIWWENGIPFDIAQGRVTHADA